MDTANVTIGSMLTRSQRLVLGLFILLLVDIIWVSSDELTKYLYNNEKFEKPFFTTYVKTSLFTFYLLGLCFWPPWKEYFQKPNSYMFLDPNTEDENFFADANTNLSTPTFVPVKTPERENVSGTESDDSSVRSVRFNKLAEVRHMSDADATEALLARLSYQASIRVGEIARRAATKLPILNVTKIAFIFSLLWVFSNYTYQLALANSENGMVRVLSSSASGLFILLLAALFPSNMCDKFTFSKLVAVFISISGMILVSLSDIRVESHVPFDVMLTLLSALCYAIYLVFLRKHVEHEDQIDIPLFFGFVGLFSLILLWPLFFFLHYTNWEHFELPNKHQFMFLVINGILGTVLSQLLWLWGCFLTSSLIATLAISLTIPLSMFADVLFGRVSYSCIFYIGTVPMLLAFLAVTQLTHYENWDPVVEMFRWWWKHCCRTRRRLLHYGSSGGGTNNISSNCSDNSDDLEQTEALIGINSSLND